MTMAKETCCGCRARTAQARDIELLACPSLSMGTAPAVADGLALRAVRRWFQTGY